jgi:hypothetical protein
MTRRRPRKREEVLIRSEKWFESGRACTTRFPKKAPDFRGFFHFRLSDFKHLDRPVTRWCPDEQRERLAASIIHSAFMAYQ